jgi:hypothetical protein
MLINNGVRYGGGPMRFEGGPNAYTAGVHSQPAQTPAGYANFVHGEATVGSAAPAFGIPHGVRHPATWMMGEVGGAIKSFRLGGMEIDANATGERGLPTTGATTIQIDGTAAGGLIVGATGTATISIDGTAAIVATLNGTGSATIQIDGAAIMGAEVSAVGSATLSIDGSAEIMAIGYMTGTTEETITLTPASIATAVWQFLIGGTTEAQDLLSTAGSGGVDYETLWASMPTALKQSLAAYVLAAAQDDPIHANMKETNDEAIIGDGTAADKFRSHLVP